MAGTLAEVAKPVRRPTVECPGAAGGWLCLAESRSAREIERELAYFAGVLHVDGYQAYKTMAKCRGKSYVAPMRLAFCLAGWPDRSGLQRGRAFDEIRGFNEEEFVFVGARGGETFAVPHHWSTRQSLTA